MRNPLMLFSIAVLSLVAAPAFAEEKPNLLFIFADDQCYDTINSLGNSEIETPNLDRLVAKSTTFTHAYNMGSWSGAVCVASRTMLNTGMSVWRANKADLKSLQEKEQLWSQVIGKAGYDTYFTGKWHVKADPNEIFTTARHIRAGMPKQTPEGYNRPIDGQPDPWSPSDPKFGGFWEGGKHWSEVVADDSVDYLTTAGKTENPFFMYLAFNAPHDPRQAPQEFVDKYPLDKIAMPENFVSEYPWAEQTMGKNLRDERLAPYPRTENSIKVNRQEYYAIITHMDREIGRILDALEASGKADNTYIFYSADHGLAVGQHGLMGKQNMFDHSVRVPLFVSGPGVAAGAKNTSPVYLQDIMATTIDLAKADRPEHVEFQSLMPVIRGESSGREAVYGAYLDRQRMITKDHKKLILYPPRVDKKGKSNAKDTPVVKLYDLAKDPHEAQDLASNPEYSAVVKTLFAEIIKAQTHLGDAVDLKAAFPDLH